MLRQSGDIYEISPIQAGMLLHATMQSGSGVDIEQIVAHLEEPVDVDRLIEGWRSATRRHPVLRTSFRWLDCPRPLQEVQPKVDLPIARLDWSDLDCSERDSRLAVFLSADRRQGFDLGQAPLSRLTFIKTATQMVMVWTFHHILLDGRSFPLVLQEVFGFGEPRRAEPNLESSTPLEFRKHIDWLHSRDDGASRPYWKERLAGFRAPVRLWVERPNSGRSYGDDTAEFGNVELHASPEATTAMQTAASAAGVTVNTLLQGAWALLQSRLSGERDIVFGATRACRRSTIRNADDMIGILINTLPVRVNIDRAAELTGWLRAIRAQSLSMRPHEHTPLAKVQVWSDVERGQPLFESIVVYEHSTLDAQLKALGGEWQRRSFQYIGQTNFPLALIAYGGERLLLRIEYLRNRFEDDVARRMLRYLEVLLVDIAERILDPHHSALLDDLRILPADERAQLLAHDAVASSCWDGASLHELFEARARETPHAEAVVAGEERLTYRQLNAKANRLAHALRQKGVRRNDVVGLAVERNADVAIGILAILKAGAAYLPLDPDYPRDRLAFVVDDAKARLVLANSNVSESLQLEAAEYLDIATAGTGLPDADPEVASAPDDLAYVIYTSGSTGKPKGVLVTHANVTRLFSATESWYAFGPHDTWPLFHSYAFDVSVWEMWGALLYGGRLVIVPYWVSRDPTAFRKLLVDERVTILNQTPSAFRQLIQADLAEAPAPYALREIIFAGEALELPSLKPWIERYGDAKPRLVNKYGITETTVHATYRPITRADVEAGRGSMIGRPIPDLYIRLLDERGEPVPVGVPGEIWVGGAGVTNGYLNRPELTAQRFVTDPFDPSRSARLYRSGDLARRLPDGDIEFLGRMDNQVKIRGFRIELGEIEAALATCPGVADAVVIAREDIPGDKRLVAYLVSKNARTPNAQELRTALADLLPAYMIPAHFIALPALPLNTNGKLDKSKLPKPQSNEIQSQDVQRAFAKPRSESERKIAAVWATVLRLEHVGVDDNFFVLGGDSILSIQVVASCRRAGIPNITTRDLFEHPTVAALARCVDGRAQTAALPAARSSGMVALTPIQHWFFEQNFDEQNHWNQAFLFEIPGDLDGRLLEQALNAVCAHHDAFRLRFRRDGDRWLALLADTPEVINITHHDLSSLPESSWAEAIPARCATEQTAIDIERGPLVRAALFRLGSGRPGRLLLAAHHLVIDGVSWRILMEDLQTAYDCLHERKLVELPERAAAHQAWAARLTEYAKNARVTAAAQIWQSVLAAPVTPLPVSSTENLEADADSVSVELATDETTALLKEVPAAYRTQINDLLLTALVMGLQRSTGGDVFLIELEGHGREDIGDNLELSHTVGWFTSLFPLRLKLAPGSGPEAALKSIKEQIRRVPDRGLTYGLLRYCSEDPVLRTSLSNSERPQLLFNYLGQFDQVTRGSKLFAFAQEGTGPWHAPSGHRTHALEVLAQIRDGKFRADWIFGKKQMSRAFIERLAADFVSALLAIINHCRRADAGGRTPSDLPLLALSQTEVDRLWEDHRGFVDAYPLTPMQRLFYVMEQAGSSVGLEQWQFRIEGQIDPALLRAAFEQAIARHSILRTGFDISETGEPVQVVMPSASLPWRQQDWRHLDTNARGKALRRELEEDARTRLEPSNPPLMRVNLVRLADDEWQVLWTTHHLCIDGWSWPRLFKEITETYAASSEERPTLFKSPLGYGHYVRWLSREAPASSAYWKEALVGFQAPTPIALGTIATTSPREAKGPPQQAEKAARLSREATQALRSLTQSAEITLSTLVQGAWALLLGHYTGARDVMFGAAFSGRPEQVDGIETLIGSCVTNVPVRVKFVPNELLRPWLARLKAQQLDLNQHQFMPLDAIQGVSEVAWQHRLFDSLLVFQNYQIDAAIGHLGQNAKLIPVQVPEATNYALTITVSPGAELDLRLIYNASRLDRSTVEAIADDLPAMMAALGASPPTATVDDILACMPAERRGKAIAVARATHTWHSRTTPTPAAPKSETERKLVRIWSELLGRSDIAIDDNFFDVGGQSLLLVRMHRLIESAFGVRLQIVKLLQHPTIRKLAANLDAPEQAVRPTDGTTERASKQRAALAKQRARAKPG